MTTRADLRALLAGSETFYAPGVYDGLSACLVEKAGFSAAYMTGAGAAASVSGKPDLGLTTLTEMADHARRLTSALGIPLIADADTGFGTAMHVYRTVQEFERAGVAAVQLEDQVFPKRCGHLDGKQVVDPEEYVIKLRAAIEARQDPDLVLIARTDARAPLGFDEAIRRANRYAEAGADVVFVEAPQTIEEIERIPREVNAPTLFNLVTDGRTPLVPADRLREMGYAFVIVPGACMDPAVGAMRDNLEHLAKHGSVEPGRGVAPTEFFEIVDLDFWRRIDTEYALPQDR